MLSVGEIAFLFLVVGALSLFASVLAFAQIMEVRDRNKARAAEPQRVGIKPVDVSEKRASRAF